MPKSSSGSTRYAASLLAVLLLALAGCTGGGGEANPKKTPRAKGLAGQQLDWRDCGRPTVAQGGQGQVPKAMGDGTRWQCAKMQAPLDYDKPDGAKIDIALVRAEAADKDRRIGSLVFNFGGPGASGVVYLPTAAEEYEKLHQRYDLVSFDPRGVGASAPVSCGDDAALDAQRAIDATPEDAGEEKATQAAIEESAEVCSEDSGNVLPHVTTENTARDMDLMREVLGDKRLNYFGISYGTQLGGVYAHLFPQRVGRTVFDAVVDPTEDEIASSLGQAEGFQLALENYMKACAEEPDCPTGKGGAEGVRAINALLEQLDAEPLPATGGRQLTQSDARLGIASALYSEELWEYLTRGLSEAQSGQGDTLLLLADFYLDRDAQGRYSNQNAANRAINCADSATRFTVDDVRKELPRFREASSVFGDELAWGLLGCTGWPVKGSAAAPDVSAAGAAPIVVIGNTGDPATPYGGAQRMAEQLGKGVGIELTYEGEGHGSYGQSDCVNAAVDGYLLEGKVPKSGTTCS